MIQGYADYPGDMQVDADVIVVGTGAGGAVVGAQLAEAGMDVLFVEEGSHHPTKSFNPYVTESVPRLYRDANATIIMGTPPIPYIEGRCVGGGTTVNGGMSWRAPERVLEGWERQLGSADFGPAGLEPYFERVERDVSVARQSKESLGGDNELMARGAAKMGWRYEENLRSQDHCVGANNCVLGCPTGAKQSTLVSYMPRALAAGARCMTDVRIDKLRIERGRCVGVEGRSIDPSRRGPVRRIRAGAPIAVVACGAVQTPVLLLRHRLGRPSGLMGRQFTCHPNAKVAAVYPDDVMAWKGVSQGGQIREFEPEGVLFAENMVPPGAMASQLPFHGADAWEWMQDYNRMVLCAVLVEDSTTGRVRRGPWGTSVVRYDITEYDHRRFLEGVRRLSTMHFELGAEKIMLPFSSLHLAHSVDDLAQITAERCPITSLDLFTVHLMGTCAQGTDASTSVVDPNGQLWDLPGCYVADASLFPTAIGVNPQITIMALAMRVAEAIESSRQQTGVSHAGG